jgi:hypothetical protein
VICRTISFHMSFQNRIVSPISASAWDIPLNMYNNLTILFHQKAPLLICPGVDSFL